MPQPERKRRETRLCLQNKCLKMNWLWRYAATDLSLWKEVIETKHGVLNNWCSKLANAPSGVGPWKYISKLGREFSPNVHFKAGNGAHRSRFLKDKWLNNSSLMVEFPTVFQIAHAKESSIADNIKGNSRDIHLKRAVQDLELEVY